MSSPQPAQQAGGHVRRAATAAAAAASCLALFGFHDCCGPGPDDVPDEGEACPPGGDGGAGGAVAELAVGDRGGADFGAWSDGGDAELYLGPQGGWMLVPGVRIRAVTITGPVCLGVDFAAAVDGLPPVSLTRDVTFVDAGDGWLEGGPVYLLLADDVADVAGSNASLTVAVGGMLEGTATLTLRLVNDS